MGGDLCESGSEASGLQRQEPHDCRIEICCSPLTYNKSICFVDFEQNLKPRQKSSLQLNRKLRWDQKPADLDEFAPESLQPQRMSLQMPPPDTQSHQETPSRGSTRATGKSTPPSSKASETKGGVF